MLNLYNLRVCTDTFAIPEELWGVLDSNVHGANMGLTGPRLAPCWPHVPCYQGYYIIILHYVIMVGLYVCYGGECFLFHGNVWWNFYVTDMCFAIHFLYIHIWLEIYLLIYKYRTFYFHVSNSISVWSSSLILSFSIIITKWYIVICCNDALSKTKMWGDITIFILHEVKPTKNMQIIKSNVKLTHIS